MIIAIIPAIIGICLILLSSYKKDNNYSLKMIAYLSRIETTQEYDYDEEVYCTNYIGIYEYEVNGKKYEFEVNAFSKEDFETNKTYDILVNPNNPQESVGFAMSKLLNKSLITVSTIINSFGIIMLFISLYIFLKIII